MSVVCVVKDPDLVKGSDPQMVSLFTERSCQFDAILSAFLSGSVLSPGGYTRERLRKDEKQLAASLAEGLVLKPGLE